MVTLAFKKILGLVLVWKSLLTQSKGEIISALAKSGFSAQHQENVLNPFQASFKTGCVNVEIFLEYSESARKLFLFRQSQRGNYFGVPRAKRGLVKL